MPHTVAWAVGAAILAVFTTVYLYEGIEKLENKRPNCTHIHSYNCYPERWQTARLHRETAQVVPNSGRIWWARNLLWGGKGRRRGLNLNRFGHTVLHYQKSNDFPWTFRSWTADVCPLDSDSDGFTNGEELGDPCCIWGLNGNTAVAWSWDITHPGDIKNFPRSGIVDLIRSTNCTTVRRNGRYPNHDKEYDAFYYNEWPEDEDPDESGASLRVRACAACIYIKFYISVGVFVVRHVFTGLILLCAGLCLHKALHKVLCILYNMCSHSYTHILGQHFLFDRSFF